MKPSQTADLYARLEIDCEASHEEIKKSYRLKALEFHPDRNHEEDARNQYDAIAEAYSSLSDPIKRKEYDQIYWIFRILKNQPSAVKEEPKKEKIEEVLKTCDKDSNVVYNREGKIETWSSTGVKIDLYD